MNRAQDNKLPKEVDFSFNLTTIPARWYFQVQQRNTYILRQTRGRNTSGPFMLTKRTISTGLMGTGLERRLEEMLKSWSLGVNYQCKRWTYEKHLTILCLGSVPHISGTEYKWGRDQELHSPRERSSPWLKLVSTASADTKRSGISPWEWFDNIQYSFICVSRFGYCGWSGGRANKQVVHRLAQSHYHSGLMMRKTKSQPERKKNQAGRNKSWKTISERRPLPLKKSQYR